MIRSDRSLFLLAMLLIAGIMPATPLRAEDGIVIDLPQPPRKNVSGLKLSVDTRWVNTNGYRPIRFTLSSANGAVAASPRKIQVVIRISVDVFPATGGALTVRDELVLPAGSASNVQEVLVPQRVKWGSIKLEFFEDGLMLRDLQYVGPAQKPGKGWNGTWTESSPGVLIIDRDTPRRADRDAMIASARQGVGEPAVLPDVEWLVRVLPVYDYNSPNSALTANTPYVAPTGDLGRLVKLQSLERMQILPFDELPVEVLGYSCFDLVIISWDDARALASEKPDRWQLLVDWIRTGASLVIFGVDPGEPGTDRLVKLLNASDSDRPWSKPDLSARNPMNLIAVSNAGVARSAVAATAGPAPPAPPAAPDTTAPALGKPGDGTEAGPPEANADSVGDGPSAPEEAAAAEFQWRPLGMGRIFAVPNPNPFASKLPWAWILNTMGRDQNWFERYGLSMHRYNNGFWNFLIRGVGRPPVVWFLVLITLFAMLAGPVSYLWLRSRGKLALLLVTVPTGSFFVTLCLLIYSILSDGLGVQWRCRSVTILDGTRGTAVSWSRHSYFAGLAPRNGLQFPRDAAVYPMEFEPDIALGRSGASRAMAWSDAQHLQSGYLGSRTPTQLLVVRSGPCDAKLEIRDGGKSEQAPQVINKLNAKIRGFVLRDSEGTFWFSEESSGEPARLTRATHDQARHYLQGFIQPWLLDSMVAAPSTSSRYGWNTVMIDPYSQVAPNTGSSLMERTIVAYADTLPLEKRTWAALVDRSPHVVPGVADVEAQDDLHLILGSY